MLTAVLLVGSIFAATVPMATMLLVIWWLDRYEREPLGLVVAIYALGGSVSVGAALVGSTVVGLPIELGADAETARLAGPVLVAPLVEEPAKALALLLLALPGMRHIDGATDGFVYGAAAGLGFATTENMLYFWGSALQGDAGAWVALVILRTLWSGLMHAVATSMVGAAAGWSRHRGGGSAVVGVGLAMAAAMGLHALWNGLVTFDSVLGAEGGLVGVALLLLPLAFLTVFAVFQLAVFVEAAALRRELLDEVQRGILAEDVAHFAASWTRRAFGRPPQRLHDPAQLVQDAMQLGLRKHQLRLRAGRGDSAPLVAEIAGLRQRLLANQAGGAGWSA